MCLSHQIWSLKVKPFWRILYRGSPNFWDAGAPPPWDEGVADPLETRFSITCVTMLNFVILGQAARPFCYKKNKVAHGRVKINTCTKFGGLKYEAHKNGIP